LAEKLTAMQEAFINHLLADPEMNGTKAAIAAGASKKGAHVQASKWLKIPKVKAALEAAKAARVKRVLTKQDRVLRQMLAVSESDIRDVLSFDQERGIRFKSSDLITDRAAAAIQSVKSKTRYKPGKDGEEGDVEVEMEIKLHPKVPMIRTLAEHLGMMPARSPVEVNDNRRFLLVIGDPDKWQGAPPEEVPPTLEAKLIEPPKTAKKQRPKLDLSL
jgi:phage terminase small subunit